MTDSLLDSAYRISFDEPDYDSCLRIPARAGCSEVDMFMVRIEPDHSTMAKRIIEWTYEPEGETTLGALVVELAAMAVGEETP